MSMYKDFKTDAVRERDGIIVDYGEFRVTVARAGGANKDYNKLLEAMSQPHQRAIKANKFSNERALQLLREVYARAVTRNWELKTDQVDDEGNVVWKQGIEAPDKGDVLPFTPENVLLTFNNLPDLFLDIMEQATSARLYSEALMEEALGN